MITPAILENNLEKFNTNLKAVCALKNLRSIQIDFADGDFIPTKTITVDQIKLPKNKISFEAHLMTHAPHDFVAYNKAGFDVIVVHYEAYENEEDLELALEQIQKLKMIPAIAISPDTEVSVLRYFTDTIKHFTLLSVIPGRQGQAFKQKTFERLGELRDLAPNAKVEIDGGVNAENIAKLIDSGASNCVVGSALLVGDIKENYQELLEALK